MVSHIWTCHKLFKYCVLQRIIASTLYFFIIRIYWDAKHPVWFMGVQSCSLLIVGLGLTDIFQNNCCNLGKGSNHYQTIFNCFLHKFRLIIFTFCFHINTYCGSSPFRQTIMCLLSFMLGKNLLWKTKSLIEEKRKN